VCAQLPKHVKDCVDHISLTSDIAALKQRMATSKKFIVAGNKQALADSLAAVLKYTPINSNGKRGVPSDTDYSASATQTRIDNVQNQRRLS